MSANIYNADAYRTLAPKRDSQREHVIVITLSDDQGEKIAYGLTPDAALTLRNNLSRALKES